MTTEEKIKSLRIIINLLEKAHDKYSKEMQKLTRREVFDFEEYGYLARMSCEITYAIRLMEKLIEKYSIAMYSELAGKSWQGKVYKAMHCNQEKPQAEKMKELNSVLRNITI